MQIPRFFIDPAQIDENVSAARIDDPQLVHQITRVLRLDVGAPVILLDGRGGLFQSRLQRLEGGSIELVIEKKESQISDGKGELTVGMPLIKPSRFEWALEKLTELGATTIIPIVTQRTVSKSGKNPEDGKKKEGKGGNVKKDRWQAIVREAAEQSERYAIPKVVAPQNFRDYLTEITDFDNALHYILAERYECPHLLMHLTEQKDKVGLSQNISLCLGPEGGFTEKEFSQAAETGLTFASMGKLILRAETAAVAAAAIISAMRNT